MATSNNANSDSPGRFAVNANNTPMVVAVGASAGGLEALEQFFTPIPANCGMAFVVIQHLDPTQKGMLPELLQRFTKMKVVQATDGLKLKSDWVYVIPPNKNLSILHGRLHLFEFQVAHGLRLPIDFFFRALADDQHERAIGVILSGMGSDGTLGLRAIKESAGLAFAQTPDSAKFDSMPRSVIDAGLADIVAKPQELWERILSCVQHQCQDNSFTVSEPELKDKTDSNLAQIVILLRERTGNDFLLYKKNTIYRRIERRMGLHQIDVLANYVRYLRENPQELDLLFKELLIGVTNFFRDAAIWEQLKNKIMPALFADYPAGKEMRAWVPACSTGEEAYSLAMVFKEALTQCQLQQRYKLQIFATDLDQDAIDKARKGYYPANIVADVSPERLKRFFVAEDQGYRINKEIREMVIFAQQNITMDPPFTKLDILSCRNLLIYFGQELQKKMIPLFHYALTSHGYLLLGNAETVGNFTTQFASLDTHSRMYQRKDQALPYVDIDFPTKYFSANSMTQNESATTTSTVNLQSLVDQVLLNQYSPPAVVVNAEGDILYINGRTGKYLEPAAGKANLNIHAMARDGLRYELATALNKVRNQTEAVHLQGLSIGSNGSTQTVNVIVQRITTPKELSGMSIVLFSDVPTPPLRKRNRKSTTAECQELLAELQQTREELQAMREERQTSQEELKSSNEELQSTNEELQSTNEELTTSKEEMQSLNEELQTVNAELQAKVTDLSWVNNDMKNLLNSMEIATVFLDNALNIRRFTSHATHIFKLITGDVGRPLSDIVTDLDYPQLHTDAQEVLNTLVFVEKQIKTNDERYFKVRIMPYRTQENVIDGVVLTFIDISEIKSLEAELRAKLT
ncbi:chemotaxis protein CheB [Methylomonas sp. AM2-LC]|uniref:chemotaxis protein CheB n=1 Tax=Methylomonas sp. AM2-LC TaxID=3153301 RepID=UPI003266A9B9